MAAATRPKRKPGRPKQFAGHMEVNFTAEQFEYIEAEAERRAVSLGQLIRDALQEKMDREGK